PLFPPSNSYPSSTLIKPTDQATQSGERSSALRLDKLEGETACSIALNAAVAASIDIDKPRAGINVAATLLKSPEFARRYEQVN
ncbi:hypothetical protein PENTCL1PPCAC_8716, partial [Pristionchus entomophagus]